MIKNANLALHTSLYLGRRSLSTMAMLRAVCEIYMFESTVDKLPIELQLISVGLVPAVGTCVVNVDGFQPTNS